MTPINVIGDRPEIPVLLAEPVPDKPRLWRVWCPYCRCYHTHGALIGHRVAHCVSSPFTETGYYIVSDSAMVDRIPE